MTQTSIYDAIARDEAMQRVAQHAEEHRPGFTEQAGAFVLRYLAEHGPTSGETLSDACIATGLKPHDQRAFGPVFMVLARRRQIEKVGTVPRRKGRGTSGGNVWALAR